MKTLYFLGTLLFFIAFIIVYHKDAEIKDLIFWAILYIGQLIIFITNMIIDKIKDLLK